MDALSEKQQIQESQYHFPYHYLPELKNGNFRLFRMLKWGYEYLGYLKYVIDYVKGRENVKSLLDVGCGDGRFIAEAQKELKIELQGVDYSEHAIRMAEVMNPGGNYKYADITQPGIYEQKFDVITLIEVLEHIPPDFIFSFMEGIKQYLAEDGQLIITVPSTNVPVNEKHYQHFNPETLEEALNGNFKVEEVRYLNKIGFGTRFMESLMVNRLFVLKQRHILNYLFRKYYRNRVPASSSNGKRLFTICTKA